MNHRLQETRRLGTPAAIALAVYLNTVGHGFVLDDSWLVVDNVAIRSLGNAGRFFTSRQLGNLIYRPLALLSYSLDYALAGLRPWFYHAENILLHAAVTVMVFLVLRRVACESRAWLAAALFAVLPVHTEVVANVASRPELLATLLGLLALWQLQRPGWAAVLLLLALLAKESAMALPALAPLLWWRAPEPAASRRSGAALGWLATAAAAYLLLRYLVYGALAWGFVPFEVDNPLVGASWPVRLRTALMILGQNLALCFVPYHLSADYSFPQIPLVQGWTEPRFLLWTALPAAAAAGALATHRSHPNFARGLAWFLVAVAPVSNLLVTIGTIRGERLLYLPSVGACLMMAEGLGLLLAVRRRLGAALALALLAALGLAAARRNLVWRNQDTALAAMVADAPRSANAHYLLAAHRMRAGDYAVAAAGFRRTLALFPRFTMAQINLASCQEALGDPEAAEEAFRKLFAAYPDDRFLAENLTRLCARRGDWRCVATAFRQLLAANPRAAAEAGAWVALGNALLQLGEWKEAEEAYRLALARGGTPVGHFNLAGLLVRAKRFREATEQYRAAEARGMTTEELYVDWAEAQWQAGDGPAAKQTAARGLARFPDSVALKKLAR